MNWMDALDWIHDNWHRIVGECQHNPDARRMLFLIAHYTHDVATETLLSKVIQDFRLSSRRELYESEREA